MWLLQTVAVADPAWTVWGSWRCPVGRWELHTSPSGLVGCDCTCPGCLLTLDPGPMSPWIACGGEASKQAKTTKIPLLKNPEEIRNETIFVVSFQRTFQHHKTFIRNDLGGIIKGSVTCARHNCTHSSVSFLLSIFTMTSLSSLAFSSLEEKKKINQPPLSRGPPLLKQTTSFFLHRPVEWRGFVSSHGHQLGKQVWSGDTGISGVDWESLHQRGTWRKAQSLLVSTGKDVC